MPSASCLLNGIVRVLCHPMANYANFGHSKCHRQTLLHPYSHNLFTIFSLVSERGTHLKKLENIVLEVYQQQIQTGGRHQATMGRVFRDKQLRDNDKNNQLFRKNRRAARRKRREEALERQQRLFRQYYDAEREVKDYIASDGYQNAVNGDSSDDDDPMENQGPQTELSQESQSVLDQVDEASNVRENVVPKKEIGYTPVNYGQAGTSGAANTDTRDADIFNMARREYAARKRQGKWLLISPL